MGRHRAGYAARRPAARDGATNQGTRADDRCGRTDQAEDSPRAVDVRHLRRRYQLPHRRGVRLAWSAPPGAGAIERRLDGGEHMSLAAHALTEAYSVLTRFPAPHRLAPADAVGRAGRQLHHSTRRAAAGTTSRSSRPREQSRACVSGQGFESRRLGERDLTAESDHSVVPSPFIVFAGVRAGKGWRRVIEPSMPMAPSMIGRARLARRTRRWWDDYIFGCGAIIALKRGDDANPGKSSVSTMSVRLYPKLTARSRGVIAASDRPSIW